MHQDDLNNLLRLLKLIGGKFIIVEDGQPQSVIMSWEEFQNLAVPHYAAKLAQRIDNAEVINKEITRAQASDLNGSLMEEVILNEEEELGDQDDITIVPLKS